VTAWRPSAGRRHVAIVTDVVALPYRSDPMRMRQVLDGLLENALRVSPLHTEIAVRARPDVLTGRPAVRIDVVDAGPGLDGADLVDAFTRGALADRYRGTRPVGSGLGLSIARRLTERLGGTIDVDSSPGSGARFTIRLPRGTA
jgi:two-component system, OmpR family, sensor kinase